MKENSFVLKGNIIYAREDKSISTVAQGYVVCENNRCAGVFSQLPEQYEKYPLKDYKEQLILPGMTDLHLHAPQYTFRGLGMDMELIAWLNTNTFPEEAKYEALEYAKQAYEIFTEDLKESVTTRACIFATIHNEATLELMRQLEESGLHTYVGRVNMDRNGGEGLCEADAQTSIKDTRAWVEKAQSMFYHTRPILTPRFIPSCSDELLLQLAELRREYGLRVQSHLSENLSEIDWVQQLVPQSTSYGQAYDLFGLLGEENQPTIMAHCVYSGEEEIALLKEHGVFIAHSPESNANIASGIAPIRKYMEEGLKVGLASDIAGGASISLFHAMELAIQMSKMYWRLVDENSKPLTFKDAFYLATLGGGSYFGKVGSFLEDYEFDAVVLDDSRIKSMGEFNLLQRAERMIYQENKIEITGKYVAGTKII